MKNKTPLNDLVIRTAVVRRPDVGYIFCGDLAKEDEDNPYTAVYRWNAGVFHPGDRNYEAHTACVIENPEPGLIDASEPGYFSVTTQKGMTSGDIFENSQPSPPKPRLGGIRSVSEIEGKGYAVGFRGMVYRLDTLKKWTRIDEGLPDSFEIEAIHGFNASDIYAVGDKGALWHFSGKNWAMRELPTNGNLNTVKCAGDKKIYVAGDHGILVRGSGNTWATIEHGATEEDIWDIEWFEEKLYVSTMENVFWLNGDELVPVDFGKDQPGSCYQLSTAKGVLWSNGEHDIMSFDGKKWSRIV